MCFFIKVVILLPLPLLPFEIVTVPVVFPELLQNLLEIVPLAEPGLELEPEIAYLFDFVTAIADSTVPEIAYLFDFVPDFADSTGSEIEHRIVPGFVTGSEIEHRIVPGFVIGSVIEYQIDPDPEIVNRTVLVPVIAD
jgi:hypothetical protein